MPFGYFKRLGRRQQAIYLRSDGITAVPLPRAAALWPLVAELAEALRGEPVIPYCLENATERRLNDPPTGPQRCADTDQRQAE